MCIYYESGALTSSYEYFNNHLCFYFGARYCELLRLFRVPCNVCKIKKIKKKIQISKSNILTSKTSCTKRLTDF